MKNLKVSKKLILSFGSVLLLMIICIAISIFSLTAVSVNIDSFYTGPFTVVPASENLSLAFNEAAKNMLHACLTTDSSETRERLEMARSGLEGTAGDLDMLKKRFGGDQSMITKIEQDVNSIIAVFGHLESACLSNDMVESFRIYQTELQPTIASAVETINEILVLATDNALRLNSSSTRLANISIVVMITVGLISVAVTAIMATIITRGLTGPIVEIENAANEMAQGHLSVDIHYQSKDELGQLANSMRTTIERISYYMSRINAAMQKLADNDLTVSNSEAFLGDFRPVQLAIQTVIASLNDTMGQIGQSAAQVSSGSDQVSSGAQALSQGATEQASSIEELAATINEISTQIKDTAANAANARTMTDEVGGAMGDCNHQMEEMLSSMDDMSNKSAEIGKIIKTIEDIAFQTNILALNAAVEAARAGEAGKGFAVVADEVRNLASKSAEASKNTAVLIEGSLQAVDKSTKLANATAQSLAAVVEKTNETAGIVDKIADAANNQATSVSQVTQGIDQISSVVQTNSATAEQSAAASEELSGQAQMLNELVGKFKLDNVAASVTEHAVARNNDSDGSTFAIDNGKY